MKLSVYVNDCSKESEDWGLGIGMSGYSFRDIVGGHLWAVAGGYLENH
jgi:hypothetical protein